MKKAVNFFVQAEYGSLAVSFAFFARDVSEVFGPFGVIGGIVAARVIEDMLRGWVAK